MNEIDPTRLEEMFLEFLHSLQVLTPTEIKEIKISIPMDLYQTVIYPTLGRINETQIVLNTQLGKVIITTPELEQIENRRKLEVDIFYSHEEKPKRVLHGCTGKGGAIMYYIALRNFDNSMSEEEIEKYRKELEEKLPEGIYKF